MKIQSTAGFQAYKSYATELKNNGHALAKSKNEHALSTQNTDTVSFSGSAAAQAEINRVSLHIANEVNDAGKEERLSSLSEAIAQGRYTVNLDELASSILGEA